MEVNEVIENIKKYGGVVAYIIPLKMQYFTHYILKIFAEQDF